MLGRAADHIDALLGDARAHFGLLQETGLPAGAADVVTCSQSFHWMEAEPTLAEAVRILRPGGVFAAYDYDWPPIVHWEVEAAFEELLVRVGPLHRLRRGLRAPARDLEARQLVKAPLGR